MLYIWQEKKKHCVRNSLFTIIIFFIFIFHFFLFLILLILPILFFFLLFLALTTSFHCIGFCFSYLSSSSCFLLPQHCIYGAQCTAMSPLLISLICYFFSCYSQHFTENEDSFSLSLSFLSFLPASYWEWRHYLPFFSFLSLFLPSFCLYLLICLFIYLLLLCLWVSVCLYSAACLWTYFVDQADCELTEMASLCFLSTVTKSVCYYVWLFWVYLIQ